MSSNYTPKETCERLVHQLDREWEYYIEPLLPKDHVTADFCKAMDACLDILQEAGDLQLLEEDIESRDKELLTLEKQFEYLQRAADEVLEILPTVGRDEWQLQDYKDAMEQIGNTLQEAFNKVHA